MRKTFNFYRCHDITAEVDVIYDTSNEKQKRFSVCGKLFAPGVNCFGQCLDKIAQYIDDEQFKVIYRLGNCIISTTCTPSANIKQNSAGLNEAKKRSRFTPSI